MSITCSAFHEKWNHRRNFKNDTVQVYKISEVYAMISTRGRSNQDSNSIRTAVMGPSEQQSEPGIDAAYYNYDIDYRQSGYLLAND